MKLLTAAWVLPLNHQDPIPNGAMESESGYVLGDNSDDGPAPFAKRFGVRRSVEKVSINMIDLFAPRE